MKKLRVGIIGTGKICKGQHLPAWAGHPDVEIVALCDIIPARTATLAKDYDVEYMFTDYRKLLAMESIDVVDICTPNYLHSIIAIEAFKQGKHVFCEKPDAITVTEAVEMKHASEKAGKLLMVMRNNRFIPAAHFLRPHIEQGALGDIYAAKCGWVRVRGIPGKGGWFTTKEQSGGGPVIDLGVHMIDLTLWLMGNPQPISVVGSTYQKFANSDKPVRTTQKDLFDRPETTGIFDVEDLAMGFIKFSNGASMQIEFSWASNIEYDDKYFELLGTTGGAKFHSAEGTLKLFGEANNIPFVQKPRLRDTGVSGHNQNIRHFVDCILKEEIPIYTPEQGVDMIKILTALYESANKNKEVILN